MNYCTCCPGADASFLKEAISQKILILRLSSSKSIEVIMYTQDFRKRFDLQHTPPLCISQSIVATQSQNFRAIRTWIQRCEHSLTA